MKLKNFKKCTKTLKIFMELTIKLKISKLFLLF